MRVRGRRVAWLLASALPLLANETPLPDTNTDTTKSSLPPIVVASTSDTTTSTGYSHVEEALPHIASQPQHERLKTESIDPDENDEDPGASYTSASEAIHNEEFKLPSLRKTDETSTGTLKSDNSAATDDIIPSVENDEEEAKNNLENTKGASEELQAEEQNEDVLESQQEVISSESAVETELSSSSENMEKENDENKADTDSSLAEASAEKLQSETLQEIDHSNEFPSETEVEASNAGEQKTPKAPEMDEMSEEQPKETVTRTDEEEEDEEDSLSRVSVDYASKSAGALIIEKSSSFKGTSNLLNGDKDKYAIAPCEERKFVVVSLSEDILVKQIKLANYERFSSTVKDFQVMGSQTLGKWFDLGTYSAKPGNGEQTFDLVESAWARYLKFKFLSHHGVEYYCTFSQIKVHGSTMVQGFHEQWEESDEDDDDDDDNGGLELDMEDTVDSDAEAGKQGMGTTSDEGNLQEEGSNITADKTKVDAPTTKETDDNASNAKSRTTAKEPENAGSGGGCVATSTNTCQLVTSSELDEKLNGALTDEELFSSLYDLIPSTLNALPKASRESPGRQTTGDGELRTLHQIGSLAMQSLYSTTKLASDAAKALIANSSDSISTPKMTDRMGDVISQYLGTELGVLTHMWDNQAVVEAPTVQSSDDVVEITTNETTQHGNKTSDLATEQNVTPPNDTTKSLTAPVKETLEDEPGHVNMEGTSTSGNDNQSSDHHHQRVAITTHETSSDPPSMDVALARMLENVPSAECLSKLDFAQFKAKMNASKKGHHGSGTSTASGSSPMEPIFKKLTDEIKLLQSSLSIHDQFTKVSVACYQRVLLDLIIETERLRTDHEVRLRNLENEFRASWASSTISGVRYLSIWIYSAVVHIYSPLFTWLSALFRVSLRFPGILYRLVLQRWPAIKNMLLANGGGGSSNLAKYLRPFADQMDQLVVEMEIADSNNKDHVPEDADDEMWKFPVVPIVMLVLLGRLVMCFASPSSGTLSSRRAADLLALRAKALMSSSPSRQGKLTTPTKKLSSSTALLGGEKKKVLDSGSSKSKTTKKTSQQDDTPPRLVSESAAAAAAAATATLVEGGNDSQPRQARPSPKDKTSRIPHFFGGGEKKKVEDSSAGGTTSSIRTPTTTKSSPQEQQEEQDKPRPQRPSPNDKTSGSRIPQFRPLQPNGINGTPSKAVTP